MKFLSPIMAAILLAGLGWTAAGQAQGLPGGSYLRSCNGARMEGDTLVARCRVPGGGEQRSALAQVRRCVGDIGNQGGVLACNFPGGAPVYGQVLPEPGYRAQPYGAPPAYGERAYGERRYGEQGYGPEHWERCRGLRREAEELRARLDREWDPVERQRTEYRLREVREQEERCR